jgi:DNA-binding MarR family transcriptional regulator
MIQQRLRNLLAATSVAISDAIEEATSRSCGLIRSDTAALLMITQWPGGTVQSIAHALALSQPATVRLIDRLEQAGLVRRAQGEKGRGHVLALYPTALGEMTCERALEARDAALRSVLSGVSDGDAAGLERVCEAILSKVTTTAVEGDRVCRLCCDKDCPNDRCPVYHQQAKDPLYRIRGWR